MTSREYVKGVNMLKLAECSERKRLNSDAMGYISNGPTPPLLTPQHPTQPHHTTPYPRAGANGDVGVWVLNNPSPPTPPKYTIRWWWRGGVSKDPSPEPVSIGCLPYPVCTCA